MASQQHDNTAPNGPSVSKKRTFFNFVFEIRGYIIYIILKTSTIGCELHPIGCNFIETWIFQNFSILKWVKILSLFFKWPLRSFMIDNLDPIFPFFKFNRYRTEKTFASTRILVLKKSRSKARQSSDYFRSRSIDEMSIIKDSKKFVKLSKTLYFRYVKNSKNKSKLFHPFNH